MAELTITITEESFAEAVSRASDKFNELGNGKERSAVTSLMMGLQNSVFASMIADELFGKAKEDK